MKAAARRTSRASSPFRLRPLALSLACIGATSAMAQLPSWNNFAVPLNGGAVTVGTPLPIAGQAGSQLAINQSSLRAIINWQSFSIGAGNQVNIGQQMGPSSVLLNRVVNNGPRSEIAGLLSAPGRVFVINPAGVLFGATAQVNVGGLVASTLDIAGDNETARNATFMAGGVLINPATGQRQLTLAGPADGTAEVTVEAGAKISAGFGAEGGGNGLVALVGSKVSNAGQINVARGSAGLISANEVVVVDPVGDGLTTFRIGAGAKADTALVENIADAKVEGAGRIVADGGLVALMASSVSPAQVVVNQRGTLQARSLENRNGEIVLAGFGSDAAKNVVTVGGTLDASVAGSGVRGGTIRVEGDTLRVDADLRAGGSGSGGNGSLQLTSNADLHVHAAEDVPGVAQISTVNANTLGRALSRGTDVTLGSRAMAMGDSGGWGVAFLEDAAVVKGDGGAASFTVNSDRHIEMRAGSRIQSVAGALNVDFNADASGSLAADAVAVGAVPRRGAILLQGARIETNGGGIRFYGQSDPAAGRAVGGEIEEPQIDSEPIIRRTAGIEITRSTLSTCGVAESSCTGGGAISLRGEGLSRQFTNDIFGTPVLDIDGTSGIVIQGGILRTGSGAITVQGRGGFDIFSAGVDIGSQFDFDNDVTTHSRITSAAGNVSIVGSARNWSEGEAVGASLDAGAGVQISSASIATGGNVSITGTGGNIFGATKNAQFLALASSLITPTFHNEGTGVELSANEITAGQGKTISITGTAGSQAFIVGKDAGGAPLLDTDFAAPTAVEVAAGRVMAEGGRIAIDGGAGTVDINACCSGSAALALSVAPSMVLSTASSAGPGGAIDIRGRNVRIAGDSGEGLAFTRLDASGAGQAGTIDVRAVGADGIAASGVLGIDFNVAMAANALSPTGNGGSIRVLGDNTLRAYGSFEAKGGAQGGNGGFIETSGGAFDVSGIRVDTSAGPNGKGGSWLIDPFNVDIINGAAAGSLTGNPFVPLANSVIQDGDINAALLSTDVTITTGVGGVATDGDIVFDDALIFYSGAAPRTFRLDAHRSIRANGPTTIASFGPGAGALNVVFNADANGGGLATGGGQISYSGQMYTNGGNVVMNGSWANDSNNGCSICLDGPVIDTRAGNLQLGPNLFTGGSDALAGGSVSLTGRTIGVGLGNAVTGAVDIAGTRISTSTGNVSILGTSTLSSGIVVDTTPVVPGGIFTTSGNIALTGVGSFTPNSATDPGHGVVIGGAFSLPGTTTLQSVNGNIDVSGIRLAGGAATGKGVLLANRTLITTTGGGNITVTGESQGDDAGVLMSAGGPGIPAAQIVGSNNVVLRASNDGIADALVVDVGSQVSAASVLGLRPGGLDVAGVPSTWTAAAVDRTAIPILLGGGATTGFAVSAAELTRMSAPTVVVGSNAHAGNIDVVGALAMASDLTLQNGGGGNIALGAPVSTPHLGLVSAGNVTQAAGASIAAGTLLARSTGGSVLLANAGNDVDTVGGGAAVRFEYVDADALTLGPVSATGYDAAANLPQTLSATSMAASTVLVRTLTDDLSLGSSVSSTSRADLVAAARFQNLGANTISGASWRVWADTWIGETRGGLAGSGPLPNLYHCAFLGLCTVAIPTADNHFIYAQQPQATVVIGNATRPFGFPNPLVFTYSITGLILGDTLSAFAGTTSTTATTASLPGSYPITGSFSSPAGYAFTVQPGTLLITAALDLPKPDVLRDQPTTYLYDRNIGQAPICLATGPLEGDRAQQGADVLAREWSRVRSRPNLLNCVDTERRNGCGDF